MERLKDSEGLEKLEELEGFKGLEDLKGLEELKGRGLSPLKTERDISSCLL